MVVKTYSELITLPTFEERFEYVQEHGRLGEIIFGADRYINQNFYHSYEWKKIRDSVIIRDNGMDLGIDGRPVGHTARVHHLMPLRKEDFLYRTPFLIDPEYMITVSLITHNALHYGTIDTTAKDYVPRQANDTCPWR